MEIGWFRIEGLAPKAHLVADGWFGKVAACGCGAHREIQATPAGEADERCEVCSRAAGLTSVELDDPSLPLETRLWMRDLANGYHEERCPRCRESVRFPFVGLALHEKSELERRIVAILAVARELGITKIFIDQVVERIDAGHDAEQAVKDLLGGGSPT